MIVGQALAHSKADFLMLALATHVVAARSCPSAAPPNKVLHRVPRTYRTIGGHASMAKLDQHHDV